jgi:hypothetical protein
MKPLEIMGKTKLVFSLIYLRWANQYKVFWLAAWKMWKLNASFCPFSNLLFFSSSWLSVFKFSFEEGLVNLNWGARGKMHMQIECSAYEGNVLAQKNNPLDGVS